MEETKVTKINEFTDMTIKLNVEKLIDDILHGKFLKFNVYPEGEDRLYIKIRNIPSSEDLKNFGIFDYSFSLSANTTEVSPESKRDYEYEIDGKIKTFTMFQKEIGLNFFEEATITEIIFTSPTEGVIIDHKIDNMHIITNFTTIKKD